MDSDKRHRNLYRLHELSDYKVASDYSDVRGWKVIDADNRTIGEVDDLIVNKATERVVYLDVEVDKKIIEEGYQAYGTPAAEGAHDVLSKDGENHIIIPIGSVHIDNEHKHVMSNEIHYDAFKNTKRFGKGQDIDRNYEVQVINIYYPGSNATSTSDDDSSFYDRSQFNRRD